MGMSLQTGAILIEDAFIFTVNTATVGSGFTGETNDQSFILPLGDNFSGTVEVDWGDGNTNSIADSASDGDKTHDYGSSGIYTIKLTGDINGIQNTKDCRKITNISNWGKIVINDSAMLYGCIHMTITASDIPTITTTAFTNMFRLCDDVTEIKNISKWDVSSVTTFNNAFMSCAALNPDIELWNMGSAIRISNMVRNTLFDRNLSGWDIADITNMANFANSTTMSTSNYDALLVAWNAGSPQSSVSAHFGSAKYTDGSAAATARANLVAAHGWTITDGGTA